MKRDYQLPPDRLSRIRLLKKIMNGEMSLEDLLVPETNIEMWKQDNDPDFMIRFEDGRMDTRIPLSEYLELKKSQAADPKTTCVTLNLSD